MTEFGPSRPGGGIAVAALVVCASGALAGGADGPAGGGVLRVEAGFPGGSVRVLGIDQQRREIRFQPADHPGRGWRCWWYFKVTGVKPGQTVTLALDGSVWACPQRAAFSIDNETWAHTAPGRKEAIGGGKRRLMVYRQRVDAGEAWFAWGPPYVPRHAETLIRRAEKACPNAKRFELCRTREKRPVPALRIAPTDGRARKRGVWVQARQHAWESGSSWVCQGLVEWLISDAPRAKALRGAAEIVVVPIMDVDNVVWGAGGKNQTPHDHNRDWSDQPHWPAVAAAIREIAALSRAGRFDVFVDLHNPGANDKQPYFYRAPADEITERQQTSFDAFLAAARAEITGPLAFKGQTRESGKSYDKNYKRISKNWVMAHTTAHVVAVTLETPWNTPHSTQPNYRRVGRELALAVERYLRGR